MFFTKFVNQLFVHFNNLTPGFLWVSLYVRCRSDINKIVTGIILIFPYFSVFRICPDPNLALKIVARGHFVLIELLKVS